MKVLVNVDINKRAKLERKEFLDRISYVEEIRVSNIRISFHLERLENLINLECLHSIINNGKFENQHLTRNKLFAVGVSDSFYSWLKNTTAETIKKQLLFWNASYYAFNDFEDCLDEEIDGLFLDEIKRIQELNFPQKIKTKLKPSYWGKLDEINKMESNLTFYQKAFKGFTGSNPPVFMKNPYEDPFLYVEKPESWGLTSNHSFIVKIAYFTEYDWIIIVEKSKTKLNKYHRSGITMSKINDILGKGEIDTLQRAESEMNIFKKWKYTFLRYPMSKEFIYSISSNAKKAFGFVYLIQQVNSKLTKIGFTNSKEGLKRRQSQIQTGNPERLVLNGCFSVSSIKTESVIHEFYKDKRVRKNGEWFTLSSQDINDLLDETWRINNNIF